jgi:hypothetical protein
VLYQSDTIAKVVKRLNDCYFLPAIQREFVWRPDQITQLFDSLLRLYPISTFLFWDLKPENRNRWDVYKFIDQLDPRDSHNEPAVPAGVQQLTLVLDGQQRLTSLLIGLKGSYTIKKKYMKWSRPDAWVPNTLYLNLFQDPEQEPEDGEMGLRYGFAFLPEQPENDDEHYWFPVSRILDFDSQDRFDQFKYEQRDSLPGSVTRAQQWVFEKNLARLHQVVWSNQVISSYTEQDQDYDRVLDIFVRANEGGTKLSKSDLLLSMITSKWEGMKAREEIYGFVDRINNDLDRKNDLDKDFVMKTCLVLSDLKVQYKVDNFNNQNLELIRQNWQRIKTAIENAVSLVNWFGIDRDTLTSANALIPIIYYFYRHPGTEPRDSTSSQGVRTATRIRRWLTAALLNGVFGGQSDNVLRDTRKVLAEKVGEPDFPLDALNEEIRRSGRKAYFDDTAMEDFLDVKYSQRETFLALSLLYDDNSWGVTAYHQDHIFPRSLFTPKKLENSGLPTEKQAVYAELVDGIGNLQLLTALENQQKSDQEFRDWIKSRDQSYRKRHLIPDDPALYDFVKFEEFVKAREELIRQRLKELLGASTSAVSGGVSDRQP